MKEIIKRCFRRKQLLLTFAAVVLCLSIPVGFTIAYFTDMNSASGTGEMIELKPETAIHETIDNLNKSITIENTGNADAFIRVKVFYPASLNGLQVVINPNSDEAWILGEDGYWYYNAVLKAGQTTPVLAVDVTVTAQEGQIPDFQIVVVHESSRVFYSESGEAYPNWNLQAAQPQER